MVEKQKKELPSLDRRYAKKEKEMFNISDIIEVFKNNSSMAVPKASSGINSSLCNLLSGGLCRRIITS